MMIGSGMPSSQSRAPRPNPMTLSYFQMCRQPSAFAARLELLVDLVGDLVRAVLDGFLRLANGLLRFALAFLRRAFDLKPVVAGGLADALLRISDRFVGQARSLVRRAAHD